MNLTQHFVGGWILILPLVLGVIPIWWAIDGRPFRQWIGDIATLGYLLAGWLIAGAGLGYICNWVGSPLDLKHYGHTYFASLIQVVFVCDFIVLGPRLLLWLWPKGGAIAYAAYRESLRQPMFWMILGGSALFVLVSMVIPYFTLGDDYKLMKQVGFDAIMLFSAIFGLLASSISINEEIEGRTAITVISKPVNRRQFLIGKYLGILMACWTMVLFLGVVLTLALYIKPRFDTLDEVFDPMPEEQKVVFEKFFETKVKSEPCSAFAKGMGSWFGATYAHHIGLFRVFGQVMIMLSISTALATRVSYIVNLVVCLGIFLIGNLSPLMVHVTTRPDSPDNAAVKLISFIAQLFNAVFPSLDSFDMGPAIIRDTPLRTMAFLGFVVTVFLYSLLYTGISLLAGLFLFEERDLA
jgi:ABC-type transport system involved in multi-copper enzyme maturation permease subunit